jgi:Ca2+-binding RTX toxin-like protein
VDQLPLQGTAGSDTISGSAGGDWIQAGDGDDTVNGGSGADVLEGGAGDDVLNGGSSNDTLIGGAGNDTLIGGYQSDRYVFNQGDGQDVIQQYDTSSYSNDVLAFGSGIAEDDLWFSRDGQDLVINVSGTDDQIEVNNWYSGSSYQLDSVQTEGGILHNAQIEQLVAAMATYDVPSGAGVVIPSETQENLHPVIVESWRAI